MKLFLRCAASLAFTLLLWQFGAEASNPGKLDVAMYNELTTEQRADMDEADKLYKEKHWRQAEAKYSLFESRYRADAPKGLPYAVWMSGCCLDQIPERKKAQARYSEVIKSYGSSPYAEDAFYRRALSYSADGDQEMALKDMKFLADNFDKVDDVDIKVSAVFWLKEYYAKNNLPDKEEELLWLLAKQKIKDNPTIDKAWQDLWDFYKNRSNWKKLEEVGLLRKQAGQVSLDVFYAQMDILGQKWDNVGGDKARREQLQPEVLNFIKGVEDKIAAAAGEGKKDMTFRLVRWCLQRNPAFGKKATDLMTAWLAANPADVWAMNEFYNYVSQWPGVTEEQLTLVYRTYLNKNTADRERSIHYVMLMERINKWEQAKAELDRIQATDWEYGHYYQRKRDLANANTYFEKVYKGGDDKLTQDAAWIVASNCRDQRNFTEAIKWFDLTRTKYGYEAGFQIGVCYEAMGEIKKAVDSWTEIYNFSDKDKEWLGKSGYAIAVCYLKAGQRPQGISWARKTAKAAIGTRYPGLLNQLAGEHKFDIKGGQDSAE